MLCEDEIARRESAALTRRIRRARFEEQSTFESFDFTANTKLPAAMLRNLSALRWLDAAESVILYEPVGVGKTHIAQALHYSMASPPLTHPIVNAGSPGMGSVSVPPFRTVNDDCSADNDDDRRASRHLHLHDNRIRITPGCAINLCLRIRRLGVRIRSVRAP